MKHDVLQQYISLQAALQRERDELIIRLKQIDDVLGQAASASLPPPGPLRRGRKGRGANSMSLRDAVLQATSLRPMTKQEVFEAVQRLGYRFGGKDPLNSLGVVLYGKNPKFKNEGGRFSPIITQSNGPRLQSPAADKQTMSPRGRKRIATALARQKGGRSGAVAGRTRRMSAQARERIAAAQRARWAKVKAGQ